MKPVYCVKGNEDNADFYYNHPEDCRSNNPDSKIVTLYVLSDKELSDLMDCAMEKGVI